LPVALQTVLATAAPTPVMLISPMPRAHRRSVFYANLTRILDRCQQPTNGAPRSVVNESPAE
jgi:hypothetical protein